MFSLSKIFPFLQNKAEKYEKWTVKVGMQDPNAAGNIDIMNTDNLTAENYMKRLKNFSEDFIEMYDEDNDGKISYDEFEKYNISEAKENLANLSDSQVAQYKQQLQTIYGRLNVDNDGDSKEQLDTKEIMNYFYVMDSNNGDHKAHGNISQYEYETTSKLLVDNSKIGNSFFEHMKNNFNKMFKNIT